MQPSKLSRIPAWVWGAAITVGALALQWSLRPLVGIRVPFLAFLPAIVFAAAVAGRGAGWLPLAAGAVSALLWLPPSGELRVASPADLTSVVLYVAFGVLLVEFGARWRRIAARARAAEGRLMLAIEGTGIGVFDIDLVAETGYVSPALARLIDLPVSDRAVPLAQWFARLPPAMAEECRRNIVAQFRARARSYERETRFPQRDGMPLWLLLRVHIEWDGERAVRLRGTCIDITDRKTVDSQLIRAKAELSQQVDDLDRLHELSSRLPDAGTLQAQLRMILAALAQFHGARRGLIWLRDPASADALVPEASHGFTPAGLARLASVPITAGASGRAYSLGERAVVADTETDPQFADYRDIARSEGFRAVHSTPLLSQQGEVIGAISIHLDEPRTPTERECALADICARKAAVFIERARAQAALAESQGRLQSVLEASAVPFVVLTPVRSDQGDVDDFVWSYLNGAAMRALAPGASGLIGRRAGEVMPARRQGRTFRRCLAVAREGRTHEFEARTRRDGEVRWLHCIASPMDDAVAVWFTDVTDRKRAEREQREADRRKDEFLATLAHELRNPLAPIRQAAQLSTAPGATEAQKRWSHEVIDRQVQHMALLLDDLLDVSRITRGALSLRKVPSTLQALVGSALETAQPTIDEMGHELQVDLPPHPVPLEADPLRVAQVVANLLTNAAKYTDRGGHIRLRAGLDGEQVVIEVTDDGIGIAARSLPHVFRMFSQLQSGRERSGPGLGIGLALSKGLVELHGGTIAVRSAGPGRGSTFTVTLPRGNVPAAAAPAAPAASRPAAPAPRRVLIADDNRDAADSLAMLLQMDGHETRLAFDGDEALAAYDDFVPDICLFDIGMPGRSGYELARLVRERPGGTRPMLVAITGWGQDHDRQRAFDAGFDHHLTKPIDPRRLAALFADARLTPAPRQASLVRS